MANISIRKVVDCKIFMIFCSHLIIRSEYWFSFLNCNKKIAVIFYFSDWNIDHFLEFHKTLVLKILWPFNFSDWNIGQTFPVIFQNFLKNSMVSYFSDWNIGHLLEFHMLSKDKLQEWTGHSTLISENLKIWN